MLRPSENNAMLALAVEASRSVASEAIRTRMLGTRDRTRLLRRLCRGESLKVAESQSLKELAATIFATLRLCDFATLRLSSPRMKLLIHALQPRPRDVRVDLRRGDVGVAEHHLHAAQVGAVLEQVRGEGMPQYVRRDVRFHARLT